MATFSDDNTMELTNDELQYEFWLNDQPPEYDLNSDECSDNVHGSSKSIN
jgi:hypothetical protein